ncbi:MAG: FMN-binding protein [Clostridiales bacterium]|nr:FMN-binding protein [Clostridiales bacterium]
MKKVGKILLVIGCILGIAVCGLGLVIKKQVSRMYEQLDAAAVIAPDHVADGTYEGTAETLLVKVTVAVTVENHTLKDIQLLRHENGKGAPAEAMLPEMLSKNTSEVDTVSGVTMSSKAIRAVVRDALAKGAQKAEYSENNGRNDMKSKLSNLWNRLKADVTQDNQTKAAMAEQTVQNALTGIQETLNPDNYLPAPEKETPLTENYVLAQYRGDSGEKHTGRLFVLRKEG